MAFTGKATYSAGVTLPEIAEDVSDLVSVVSPYETPLLDLLGDAAREARSTIHEWLEDELMPNHDAVADAAISDPNNATTFHVAHVDRFRPGDQIRIDGIAEMMLVMSISPGTGQITVIRGHGGTTKSPLLNDMGLVIIGNAAMEGDSADSARFTARGRRQNYTQIFSATVEVSGSELAVRQLGVADEVAYQKQQRLRELLRDLENTVINGRAPATNPQGGVTGRRTMSGLLAMLSTNRFAPGTDGMPVTTVLGEEHLNAALRRIWENSASRIDTILVGAAQKRLINGFIGANRHFGPADQTFRDLVSLYESDFGLCRIVLSRYVPADTVVLLDSTRIDVLPLAGRSFQYRPLAAVGDRESGQLIGEYTLELRNENAHGMIRGLEV